MRVRILLAAVSLLVVAGLASYFWPELKQFTPIRHLPGVEAERKLAEARTQYPLVSLTGRLPKGKAITPTKALSAEVKEHWEQMESWRGDSDRSEMLKALHERTRDVFVARPGAGWGRMKPERPEDILVGIDYGERDHAQPGEPAYFPISTGETVTRVQPDGDFRNLHRSGVLGFFPYRSFGYIKDRDHVAGFRPHGFRQIPSSQAMRVDHVQLVGILKHDRPVVYLTDKLPTMEQVRPDKTRTIDLFEEAGLSSLREGEDLYIVRKEDTLRMLGALRATKTCLKCHDAEAGDLLGAFSYTLKSAAKSKKNVDDGSE